MFLSFLKKINIFKNFAKPMPRFPRPSEIFGFEGRGSAAQETASAPSAPAVVSFSYGELEENREQGVDGVGAQASYEPEPAEAAVMTVERTATIISRPIVVLPEPIKLAEEPIVKLAVESAIEPVVDQKEIQEEIAQAELPAATIHEFTSDELPVPIKIIVSEEPEPSEPAIKPKKPHTRTKLAAAPAAPVTETKKEPKSRARPAPEKTKIIKTTKTKTTPTRTRKKKESNSNIPPEALGFGFRKM